MFTFSAKEAGQYLIEDKKTDTSDNKSDNKNSSSSSSADSKTNAVNGSSNANPDYRRSNKGRTSCSSQRSSACFHKEKKGQIILNNSVKRLSVLLCSITAVMLVFMTGITAISANALDNNIYEADAHPHYCHPVTGNIEDSGGSNNEVLGQSMTEGALRTESLIEVDSDGNMFATVRLALMDNIENPQFKVQNDGNSDFYDVSADLIKENYDTNESDFRFQIPNENCIVRCTVYVVPMGHDVIFYIDFDNIREGSGDFVTSVEVRQPSEPEQPQDNEPVQTEAPQQQTPQQNTTAQTTTKATSTTKKSTSASSSAVDSSSTVSSSQADPSSQTTTTVKNSLDSADVKGLEIFDENGNRIEMSSSETDSDSSVSRAESGNSEKSIAAPIAVAAGALVIAGGAGIVIWEKRRL